MTLRFMVIVPANEQSEAGVMPSEQDLAAMGKFNEDWCSGGTIPSLSRQVEFGHRRIRG
jgi:hypothetical protein